MNNFLPIQPGEKTKKSLIPTLSIDNFSQFLIKCANNKGYVVQLFGYEENSKIYLIAVMRYEANLLVGQCEIQENYPSLTILNSKFHLFEREIAEQFGIKPLGHPWMKNVRFHKNWLGRKDAFNNVYDDIPGNYPYFKVDGDEIHEVAVGPVHAGIIEPGHFRFQCIGEKVLHLEIHLGYQHRNVERLLASADFKRLPIIVESIAGDSAIANSICFSTAIESLMDIRPNHMIEKIRIIALELERVANHTGDLGALAGDVAFSTAASYFGRLRGDFLNLLLLLSGNRFGKGFIRPNITPRWNKDIGETIKNKIDELEPQLREVADLLFSAHTVLGRFEGCGVVTQDIASEIGLVGFAGRASGLDYDVRYTTFSPNKFYDKKPDKCPNSGDVYARARIRYEEIMQSLDYIKTLIQTDPSSFEMNLSISDELSLSPDSFVVTMTESWRGELSHCVLTDKEGKIHRYKVKDPSFHNWTGLAMALRNEGISDFPLNNKSFNLSYCGFDL